MSPEEPGCFELYHRERPQQRRFQAGLIKLDSSGITWTGDKQHGSLNYGDIRRIFLLRVPDEDGLSIGHCTIGTPTFNLQITSQAAWGAPYRTETYRNFIHLLHDRLEPYEGQTIEFAHTPRLQTKTAWMLLAGFAVFFGVPVIAPQVSNVHWDDLTLWGFLAAGMVIWFIILACIPRVPQFYSPREIPKNLLP